MTQLSPSDDTKTSIGNTASVRFIDLNKTTEGKIDTGATTSSIHATNISVQNGQVSFNSPALSSNTITMRHDGSQDVHSADGGGQARPVVNFDIEISGIQLPNMAFNLNDRSNMDSMVLIGQNVLQAGNFVVDVSQPNEISTESVDFSNKFSDDVISAVKILLREQLSFEDFLKLARTVAVVNNFEE